MKKKKIDWDKIKLTPDEQWIEDHFEEFVPVPAEEFEEIIIATNATLEGDSTSLYLQRRLSIYSLKITRLARGLPVGGDLEYTDEITLSRAFEGRQEMQ